MDARPDGEMGAPPLDFTFSRDGVAMDPTTVGIPVDRAGTTADLHATRPDRTTVRNRWFERRPGDRNTEASARRVHPVWSSRVETGDRSLPAVPPLHAAFERCETRRDGARVPSLVASGDCRERDGAGWPSAPLGWLPPFRGERSGEPPTDRLAGHDPRAAGSVHGELRFDPTDEPFGRAGPPEDEE